ncbi:MAG: hypothetical protein KAT66_04690 [Candidatus Lokiarchaeota archaeon]|nr:hypothetical protein [Candidatus Lokiarchaeota archaeon]
MENMKKKQTVGRPEPEFKFDIGTVVCIIIGFVISWINMLVIYDSMEIWSYLSIIFTSIIPGVLIAIKNRYWGYGYIFGFSAAGIPFLILIDPFIGGYTFVTALLIFIILWLIFWKAWRSLSSIKKTNL